jgi:hypothetical protein
MTCPECAEEVEDAALVCRFCSHRLGAAAASIGTSAPPAPHRRGLETDKRYEQTTGQRDIKATKVIVFVILTIAIAMGVEHVVTTQIAKTDAQICQLNPDAC